MLDFLSETFSATMWNQMLQLAESSLHSVGLKDSNTIFVMFSISASSVPVYDLDSLCMNPEHTNHWKKEVFGLFLIMIAEVLFLL